MKIIKKSWDFLGSRNLSVFIFIMGMVYYLLLYAFSLLVPDWWLLNLSKLLPYQVFYILFIVNLVICEIKWIPVILRRCKKPEAPSSEELNRFRKRVEIGEALFNRKKITSWLKINLYSIKEGNTSGRNNDLVLYAFRGRFSPLGNLMFHVAFILILTGVYMSLQYRFEGKVYLIEGQKFNGTYGEYANVKVAPGTDFMKSPFRVKEIKTNFWENQLLFTDLRAEIVDSRGEIFPVWLSKAGKIDGHRITIKEVSYTLNYNLREKNGKMLDEGAVNLANFGPGTFDSFQIPGFPYKISVSIYPDATISKGAIVNRSMNLNNPFYYVKVMKNKGLLYSGIVKGRESFGFDKFMLSFPKVSYIGAFSIVKDPGIWWIITAFFIMITGLLWRMVFCKNEVALVREGAKIVIYARSDYYSVTLMEKCSKVATV